MNKKNFFDFNFENLKHFLKQELNIDNKKVSMRSNQIWQHVYQKGVLDIKNLTTLPLELREKLDSLVTLQIPTIKKKTNF